MPKKKEPPQHQYDVGRNLQAAVSESQIVPGGVIQGSLPALPQGKRWRFVLLSTGEVYIQTRNGSYGPIFRDIT